MIKLSFEQTLKKLEKYNLAFMNILDAVEEDMLPMYVYSAEWHYDGNDENELINYLLNEVSVHSANYQAYPSCIHFIKEDYFAGQFQNIFDELVINVQFPNKTDRPEQYKELFRDLKEQLIDSLEHFISNYPNNHEENWETYYEYEKDDSIDLDENIDWDYYQYHDDFGSYRTCEAGQVQEINGISVHQDTYDHYQCLKLLLEEYRQKEYAEFNPETYELVLDDSEEISKISIKPGVSELSHDINIKQIYFIEEEVNTYIDTITNSRKSNTPKIHKNTEVNALKREEVLGAAVSVLANFYEECKNKQGKLEASKIVTLIDEKGHYFWNEDGIPPLSKDQISRHVNNWIKKSQNKPFDN